jgi:hypothetical protein
VSDVDLGAQHNYNSATASGDAQGEIYYIARRHPLGRSVADRNQRHVEDIPKEETVTELL